MADLPRYVAAPLPAILDGWIGPVEGPNPLLPLSDSQPPWITDVLDGTLHAGKRSTYGGRLWATEEIRLDAVRPEVAHRLVDWARAGGRCPTCKGSSLDLSHLAHHLSGPITTTPNPCPVCFGTGWLRRPYDLTWALPVALGGGVTKAEDSGARLVHAVGRIAAGHAPVDVAP